MTTTAEYGQISLYVYNVLATELGEINRPRLPSADWQELDYQPDNTYGFSYGVFKNNATGEVVVSFTGTNEKKIVDFFVGEYTCGSGFVQSSDQCSGTCRREGDF